MTVAICPRCLHLGGGFKIDQDGWLNCIRCGFAWAIPDVPKTLEGEYHTGARLYYWIGWADKQVRPGATINRRDIAELLCRASVTLENRGPNYEAQRRAEHEADRLRRRMDLMQEVFKRRGWDWALVMRETAELERGDFRAYQRNDERITF